MAFARTPRTPAARSAYSVPRPPCVVSTTLGCSPQPAPRTAETMRSALSCAWPAFEASDRETPSRARRQRNRRPWDFVPYDTHRHGESGFPGGSTPPHLPSSGFVYPLDGLLLAAPGSGPSTAAASMGFALQGLAPPGQRHPSRGLASPVVPPHDLGHAGSTPEDRSGAGRGPCTRPKAATRTLPSWVFAPPGLSPPPPWSRLPATGPSCHWAGGAPYGSSSGLGYRGLLAVESAGLSRDCRPSWGFAPFRTARLFEPP
jgi:hypothetical protein